MTAQLINFTAVLNSRRAIAKEAMQEAARIDRLEAKVERLAAEIGAGAGTVGAALAEAIVRAEDAATQAANASRYMPAYCDPSNEFRGSKYDATRNLRPQEIAKRIRQDIKAAIEAGTIPKIKASVTSDHNSINIRVMSLPEGFKILSEKFASWMKQFPNRWDVPISAEDQKSDQCRALLKTLQEIHASYNRDNSDSMVDYFDVNYYGHAELDYSVRDTCRAREIEEAAGDYWAE